MVTKTPVTSFIRRSPFGYLKRHMESVAACAGQLTPLFEALLAGDADALGAAKAEIENLEEAANRSQNDCRANLPSGLFMSIDRNVLLEMMAVQDEVANQTKEIAAFISQRTMKAPDALKAPLNALVAGVVDTCHKTHEMVSSLEGLQEAGFKGHELDEIQRLAGAFKGQGAAVSELCDAMIRAVFEQEQNMEPVTVMCWYQITHWLRGVAGSAVEAGSFMPVILAE